MDTFGDRSTSLVRTSRVVFEETNENGVSVRRFSTNSKTTICTIKTVKDVECNYLIVSYVIKHRRKKRYYDINIIIGNNVYDK